MMNGYQFDNHPEMPQLLQREAREAMKAKILADILADINIFKLEGWDWRQYPKEIVDMINEILEGR